MKSEQRVHLGMINSFNVITGRATMEQVVSSGLGIFAHYPGHKDELESIEFMIFYFKELEMYERCSELRKYIEENFNEDGTTKIQYCDCENPEIEVYAQKTKCSICKNRLRRH